MITTGIRLGTVEDTQDFGRRLAAILRPGDLVLLTGPLGAGKTAMAQGIGTGLQVVGPVTSPTFVISSTSMPTPSITGRPWSSALP